MTSASPQPPIAVNAAGDLTIGGSVVAGNQVINIKDLHLTVQLPAPAAPPAEPPTRLWPATDGEFSGREAELASLLPVLEAQAGVVVWGPAGVGKTQLAVQLAENYAGRHKAERLYLDLQGTHKTALTVPQAMARLLEQLTGRPVDPVGDARLEEHYQGRLSQQPALLVLDNAKNSAQVEALRPPRNCKLIVTSRQRIVQPGLHLYPLHEFTPAAAHAFLLSLDYPGTNYAAEIGQHADQIAALCGGLRFALEKSARAFASRAPHESAEAWLAAFAGAETRLAQTEIGTERALAASAAQLEPDERRAWHMLAVFAGAFDLGRARALWGLDERAASSLLTQLWQASLIEYVGGVRYRLHELTRLYVAQQLTPLDQALAEHNLQAALAHATPAADWVGFLTQCLLNPVWKYPRLKPAVAQALRAQLRQTDLTVSARRTAAFRLIRLRWLGRLDPDELLACLDLVGPFVTHPDNLAYLARALTQALERPLAADPAAVLRVHRAAKLGALGQLDQAEADYRAALAGLAGRTRLQAQAHLGLGNILRLRAQQARTRLPRLKLLQQSLDHYQLGERLVRAQPDDVLVRVTLLGLASYTYALLERWAPARRATTVGFQALKARRPQLEPADYLHYTVWLLEQASLVLELEAAAAQQAGKAALARRRYQAAYELARQAVSQVDGSEAPEGEALIVACNNAGRFLWEAHALAGRPAPALQAQAADYWRRAAEVAHRLNLREHAEEAEGYLRRFLKAPA